MGTILLVDDVKTVREQFAYDLKRKTNSELLTAENGREALQKLQEHDVDVIVLDLEMPMMDGLEMLEQLHKQGPGEIPVIVYTAAGNFQRCVRAVQLGAYNFFDKNEVSLEQLAQAVENALAHRLLFLENLALRRAARQDSPIIGASSATVKLQEQIRQVAEVPSNVLIFGESGTGKELVAREIHRNSPRSRNPFVALNCAAIPENLVESELFGFEKGAFSGAGRTTKGKFESANGGTLFLDEIGDMPISVQAKLLRVLQEGEVTRLGGESRIHKVDVRVVAATHRDLESAVETGAFRSDLFFRICTHLIDVPPLRDRLQDIDSLTVHFVERTCERFGRGVKKVNRETLQLLRTYDWHRNNIRELENIVERMIIQCPGEELLPEHVPADILGPNSQPDLNSGKTLQQLKEDAERNILEQALAANDWHISNTAKALGVANHSNLLKMMRRLQIKRPEK